MNPARHPLALDPPRPGAHADALRYARESLPGHGAAGHRARQAKALNAVGWYHTLLGNREQALACCGRAIDLYREHGNRTGEAATWDSLALAHHELGGYARAVDCYQHALELRPDLDDRYDQAGTLTRPRDAQEAAGRRRAARDAWRQALGILGELGHPDGGAVRDRLSAGTEVLAARGGAPLRRL